MSSSVHFMFHISLFLVLVTSYFRSICSSSFVGLYFFLYLPLSILRLPFLPSIIYVSLFLHLILPSSIRFLLPLPGQRVATLDCNALVSVSFSRCSVRQTFFGHNRGYFGSSSRHYALQWAQFTY